MAVGQLLNIGGNLVLVPLFLSRWPLGVYGEWMALSAVAAYFSVTDLGMNSASANSLVAAYARHDMDRYRRLQGSAMAFFLSVALVATAGFGILTSVTPILASVGIREIPAPRAFWVAWILAGKVLWQMPAGQLWNVYRTIGRLPTMLWIGNLQSFGLLAVSLVVLLLRGGVLELAVWSAVPMLVAAVGTWCALRFSHASLMPKLTTCRISGIRELLRPSLMFGLIMFATVLSFQGPVIIVSRVLGGAAVALLVTTRTLANVIRTVVMMLNNTLWPELTHLDAIGASETLRLTHRLTAVCFTMLSAAFAAALWFEGPEVTTVWTRGTLVLDVWLLRLFLLVLVLQAPWLASSLFTISSSRHGNLAYCYLGSAVLPLVASAVLIRPIGLLAVPFGTLLGEAIACYHFVVKDTCRVLNEDYPRYAVRLWAGVIAMLLGPWGAGWLGHYFAFGPAPLRWLEVGSMTTLAALLCAWGVALPKNDRVRLLHWLRSKSSSQNGASVSVLA